MGLGLAFIGATLGDFGDGRLGDFQLGIRRPDRNGFLLHTKNHAEDSARRDNFVARLDGLEQVEAGLGELSEAAGVTEAQLGG